MSISPNMNVSDIMWGPPPTPPLRSAVSSDNPNLTFNKTDLEIINKAINRNNIFIHGPSGTGKSCIIAEIAKRLVAMGRTVAITATTGAAAVNVGGTTLHRFAGIGLGDKEKFILLKRVMSKRKYVDRWRDTDVLIIDECSMLGGDLFDKIEYVGRNVKDSRSQKPFAGMQVIVSGDLLQLPPIHDVHVFQAKCWKTMEFAVFNLKIPKRYDTKDYFSMLLRVREAEQTSNDIELLKSRHQAYLDIDDISTWEIQPTIIYSYKIDVSEYNERKLDELPGEALVCKADDSFTFKRGDSTEEQREYYKKMLSDAIPEYVALKKGAQVILKKNLDVDSGLVNGSRGVVMALNTTAKVATVKFCNEVLAPIAYEMWELDDDDAIVSRMQIPLVLGWACTVHSSQGSTLDLAICDGGDSIFSPGQFYVAIGRVRSVEGLYLSDFNPKVIRCDKVARSFVRSLEKDDNSLIRFEDEDE